MRNQVDRDTIFFHKVTSDEIVDNFTLLALFVSIFFQALMTHQ